MEKRISNEAKKAYEGYKEWCKDKDIEDNPFFTAMAMGYLDAIKSIYPELESTCMHDSENLLLIMILIH